MMNIDHSKKFAKFFDKITQKRNIDLIILHHIEANSSDHAISQLLEHGVSSHFLIDEEGKIFELVAENNIAYHAGISHWKGQESLNQNSIGIEFINSNPEGKKFEQVQMNSGLKLCQYLMKKYAVKQNRVIGHSDIAFDSQTNLHNRKQDPSHLFDWKFLGENGVGIFPHISANKSEIFAHGDKSLKIEEIKKDLQKLGYRVTNFTNEFDDEMKSLALVFNRKYLSKDLDYWCERSSQMLKKLLILQ